MGGWGWGRVPERLTSLGGGSVGTRDRRREESELEGLGAREGQEGDREGGG